MAPLKSYRELLTWKAAFQLGIDAYRESERFPATERFGLTAQLRRSAVSIAANIAEGYGRRTRPEYLRFLDIARGSLYEFETLVSFAKELAFLAPSRAESLEGRCGEARRLLIGLARSLRPDGARTTTPTSER